MKKKTMFCSNALKKYLCLWECCGNGGVFGSAVDMMVHYEASYIFLIMAELHPIYQWAKDTN